MTLGRICATPKHSKTSLLPVWLFMATLGVNVFQSLSCQRRINKLADILCRAGQAHSELASRSTAGLRPRAFERPFLPKFTTLPPT